MRDTLAVRTIIGTRKDGRPIYLIQGAEDDPNPAGGDPAPKDDPKPGDDPKPKDDPKPGGRYEHITDPAALRALIEQREAEAAQAGGKARDNARAKAAADAKREAQQEIAKLLGLTTDDQDPAKLQSEVQQLRAQNVARDRELLTYRQALAPGMNVDVGRLTDSRSFMAKLDGIDPSADDAPAQITALIKAAVTSDQSLKSAQVRGSSVDHAGGPGDNHSPDLSKSHGADLLAGAYAANASKNTN